MKTNALEYLKRQHCQFRLSEHILSSAYPIIGQIMEEYAELSRKQANEAKQSDSNCNIPLTSGCFSDIEIKATIVERIGIMALKNKITGDFKKGFESGFYACLDYIKHK